MKEEALTLPEEALRSLPASSVIMETHPADGNGTPFYDHLKAATDGRGKISIYPVFPGIELSFLVFQAGQASFHHAASPHVLEISHCCRGRVGWDLKKGMSVYLGAGDLTLHSTDCCADSVMRFPLGLSLIHIFPAPGIWNVSPASSVRETCEARRSLPKRDRKSVV